MNRFGPSEDCGKCGGTFSCGELEDVWVMVDGSFEKPMILCEYCKEDLDWEPL